MSVFAALTGLFRPAKELIEVFTPNAEKGAERQHAERLAISGQDLASLQQFATEFHTRAKRTWWDSAIDGLNRLPRPLITLGILAFFVLAPLDPVRFLQIARAYELMPDGFWALLGVIVAFYFGGRMQLKRQDMAVKGQALAAAHTLLAERVPAAPAAPPPAAATDLVPASQRPAATVGERRPNRIIAAWQQRALPGAAS
jgi:hypothetical protein